MSGPPPPRPAIMDPLHITEFASDTYFQKLSQQRQQQEKEQQQKQQQQQQEGQAVDGPSVAPPQPLPPFQQSQFILPLRDSKPIDSGEALVLPPEPKEKKRRFGLSHLLKKSQPTQSTQSLPLLPSQPTITVPQEQKRISFGEVAEPRIVPFDELFLNLPTELQIQVIASLPLSDVLNLRLASRAWHSMVTANEGPIVRHQLEVHVPAYAKRLYPPDYTNLNFHYLCGLWHRLHVAAKLSFFICEWVTKEIFLRTSEAQKLEFAPQRERMRRRLIPLLFTIFHFFETYRARHVQYLLDHDGKGLQQTPYTLNPIEVDIMNMYDDRTLLQVHQVFPLVVASFCRRLRPPSYVGRVEKSIRGYLKEKPADEVHVAALCVGGLRQVERFWEIKGYNSRVGAVDSWYTSLAREPVEAPNTITSSSKPKRGFFSRKKSTLAIRDAANAQGDPFLQRRESADSSWARRDSFIFHTSLSAGMPMETLPQDQLELLIPDLPVLQKLWLTTAEALILDKKIVERPSDIRRNAQVMLELIREEGIVEEDEWWYGSGAHASVRPPLDSIEEDPIEEGPM